ncbi:hypothetical protein MAXJ12_30807 [Mesorhizobium alhagi CCNWXJ12-2]|uniref:Uncharacterized protein n=1 Tax=Mesorhizobium alhagi CCNWXJ12-2 TaxID=1107882 RepID=H0I124_9HYPH|nr:hypothetical protein MAXJ12_30807 [Mesorhizobium alhagi CCNWXJ12-2]
MEELRVAIQSNTPVHRRAEDQLTDVSRIIVADVEGDLVTLYTWLLRGRLRDQKGIGPASIRQTATFSLCSHGTPIAPALPSPQILGVE